MGLAWLLRLPVFCVFKAGPGGFYQEGGAQLGLCPETGEGQRGLEKKVFRDYEGQVIASLSAPVCPFIGRGFQARSDGVCVAGWAGSRFYNN